MRVVLTGAEGFLGWHVRCRMHTLGGYDVVPVGRAQMSRLPELAADAGAVLHVAGVNRGTDEQVEGGNVELAWQVAAAVRAASRPITVVFANSVQSSNGTPYGRGKQVAATLLEAAARETGAVFVDVRLPNLFGEHGRPHYNSFVATFAHALASGTQAQVVDREVRLLHAQDAAQVLLEAVKNGPAPTTATLGRDTSVVEVYDKLTGFRDVYQSADLPALVDDFDVALFNTFRAVLFPQRYPMPLARRADSRGDLVECVRSHGGEGASFVSTTRPGVTRGEHFHLSKVERFVVLRGRARIALRRLFSDEVVAFEVSGDEPAVLDMPTMWAHNITNTGSEELLTLFWTHRVFDPQAPDTYAERVELGVAA